MSLNSRRRQLQEQLSQLGEKRNTLASTALYFGGRPVIGSRGIQAEFASKVLDDYRDSVVNMWASTDGHIASRGPVPDQDSAKLHVTELLHGSVGFLIEEIDLKAMPLFPTALKKAADAVDGLIVSVAKQTDDEFERDIEKLHPRVFRAVERLIKNLHQAEATIRLVDESRDEVLTTQDVGVAYTRLEATSIEDDQFTEDGLLIGLLPYGERFEFRRAGGQLITGKVSPSLSESYLKRLREEQAINKWWRATISRREVRRFGRSNERFLLLDLEEIKQPALADAPQQPDSTSS
ncbi:hypothetical protein [Terriglobus sp. TAA 43]|uniref:hypothetical protein n=1 Tax=Terriglobus sp. TAA 43 TaxID=278961 RepID=UPI0012EEC4BB|nr:hypothetical protein [Terriglobus sp. TAA 43]